MTLPGTAFLAIFHDVAPGSERDYMEWHTREHAPERVSVPGFTNGKRLANPNLSRQCYGSLYGGHDVETFRSPAYMERLNDPTPWTQRVQSGFRNFLRMVCETLAAEGQGEGGAIATMRLDFDAVDAAPRLRSAAPSLAYAMSGIDGISCVTIGLARPDISAVKTKEAEIRPTMAEKPFDAIVIVEGSGMAELEAALAALESALQNADCGIGAPDSRVHTMAFSLSAAEMG